MTYDLRFYRRGKTSLFSKALAPLTAQELTAWARSQPHITMGEAGQQGLRLLYQHPNTGVDFILTLWPTASQGDVKGYQDTGLRFVINYARPSFYALEAMPIIAEMARALDLLAINPQDAAAATTPQPCDAGRLIETWSQGNAQAFKVFGDAQHIPTMKRDRSLEWWRYTAAKRDIERRMGSGVFVPNLFLIALKDEASDRPEMFRSLTWVRANPTVFPPVDYISIIAEAGMGLVRAERIFEALAPYLEHLDHPSVERLEVLRAGHDAEVGPIYDALTVDIPIGQFAMVKGNEALFDDTVE